jgi:ABC-2 type transport system ATP-binding protein
VSSAPALAAAGLGKRYGSRWALRDCTFEIPPGSVTALLGPNGAGKTTLLHLAVGLSVASAGTIRVFGARPREDARDVLRRVGFVSQDHALYRGFTVADMLTFGRRMNGGWDAALARTRLKRLGIPPGQKVGRLSGGQRAQVALTLALAKRPELLVLDEPVASLDPLARREFLQMLMEAAADGLTILLSSHIVADLERVCDRLVILASGRVELAGEIEQIVSTHRVLSGPRSDGGSVARVHSVIAESHTTRQTTLLVRANGHVYDSCWQVDEVALEEIVLGYLGRGRASEAQERQDPAPIGAPS